MEFLKKRIIFLVILFVLTGLSAAGLFWRTELMDWLIRYYAEGLGQPSDQTETAATGPSDSSIASECLSPDACRALPEAEDKEVPPIKTILLEVPFACQAPFGEWEEPIYQDACEEVAALMAIYWTKGVTSLSKERVKEEIRAISDYQQEKYGEYRDTSARDTVDRIIKGYYGYDKVEVKSLAGPGDIAAELEKNRLVIVPANGQVLGNPFFTQPGPERHMVVIRGYDPEKQQFITNDAGTRHGEKYRYQSEVLFGAIGDYPTGYHLPLDSREKVMIVLWR